jgi:hypothetical protein
LYNYLRKVLETLGQAEDFSPKGVESVVNAVIRTYAPPPPEAISKIRKTLTVMTFACVCTNVKRRTEAMMDRIRDEIENPGEVPEDDFEPIEVAIEPTAETEKTEADASNEGRKTVAQTIREWDQVEIVVGEETGRPGAVDDRAEQPSAQTADDASKPARKPWYSRRNT